MKHLVVYILSTFLALCNATSTLADDTDSRYLNYIEQYHTMAQEQQQLHNIPASITLAQGLLESAAGDSQLAVDANNHFGIKCHDWGGEGIQYKGDCYRKYNDVAQSYHDHSMFLLRPRYKELYALDITDYKGWAEGLKRLGYAEDPQYAHKLISLIERYKLDKYACIAPTTAAVAVTDSTTSALTDSTINTSAEARTTVSYTAGRPVYRAWDMLYTKARQGDTYQSIANDMGFNAKNLAKYNENKLNATLQAGEIVYLEKKRRKAVEGCDEHTVTIGETIYSISQKYGIEYRRLARRNKMKFTATVKPGMVLKLR